MHTVVPSHINMIISLKCKLELNIYLGVLLPDCTLSSPVFNDANERLDAEGRWGEQQHSEGVSLGKCKEL